MGQQNSKSHSRNILILGITLLLDLKLLNSEWVKDQNNSSQDFSLYIKSTQKSKYLLWCPRDNYIMRQTIESIILNIEFEGVILVFEQTRDQVQMWQHKRLIKWLMNEDSMRQCSLIIICITTKENEEIEVANLKSQLEVELDFDLMDSKQSRQLIIQKREKETSLNFQKILNLLMKMKDEQ